MEVPKLLVVRNRWSSSVREGLQEGSGPPRFSALQFKSEFQSAAMPKSSRECTFAEGDDDAWKDILQEIRRATRP